MLGGGGDQFILLPVILVALVNDGGAGLVVHNLIGAGGHRVGGHLIGRCFIRSLGHNGAFHQQGFQITRSQSGEMEASHIVADDFNTLNGSQLGQIAHCLGRLEAELDVACRQGIAGLVNDVVIQFHIVGQFIDRGQFLHQTSDKIVAVLDHQHFIGGKQDTDTSEAHALERSDVAGIARQADHNGAALLSRGKADHGENHDGSQDQRQELFHLDVLLQFGSVL